MTSRASNAQCTKHWSRLAERLDLGLTCKLTLLTAPAGFGKSSLLAFWADGVPVTVVVIDLKHNTDAPALIKTMAQSLRELFPTYVPDLTAMDTPCEEILVELINAVAAVPQDIAIVFDDYCSEPRLDECLGYLLEYLPPQLHLYVSGEAMPGVSSLPRLRVRRQLVELTESDLGLTAPEVGHMVSMCLHCQVEVDDAIQLAAITHGSIAAMRSLIDTVRSADDPLSHLKRLAISSTPVTN